MVKKVSAISLHVINSAGFAYLWPTKAAISRSFVNTYSISVGPYH